MTYGADFRPGMNCLPRHDNVKVPSLQYFRDHLAALQKTRGVRKCQLTAERMRRICFLMLSGNSLNEICGRMGLPYLNTRKQLLKLPQELRPSLHETVTQ